MATALARGWLQAGLVTAERIMASDPIRRRAASLARDTGTTSLEDNRLVVQRSDVLLLAVKPQNMAALLGKFGRCSLSKHLVISIAAGVTLGQLADALGSERRLVRVMPIRHAVWASAAGYACRSAPRRRSGLVDRLLNASAAACPPGKIARRGHRSERQRPGVYLCPDRKP